MSQHLSNAFEYKKGIPVSSTVIRSSQSDTKDSKKVTGCQAWYLVTTYFWSDGTTTESSQFIGTTGCGGAPPNEELVPPSSGDGLSIETPPDTTCAQSERLKSDADFAYNLNQLKNMPMETGYTMVRNGSSYSYAVLSYQGSTSNTLDLANVNSPINGFMHNHTSAGEKSLTLTDLAGMYNGLYLRSMMADPGSFMFAGVFPDNTVQILRVSNEIIYASWANNHLSPSTYPTFLAAIGNNFSPSNTYEQQRLALLNAIKDSGLSLFEADLSNMSAGFTKLELTQDVSTGQNVISKIKCSN